MDVSHELELVVSFLYSPTIFEIHPMTQKRTFLADNAVADINKLCNVHVKQKY